MSAFPTTIDLSTLDPRDGFTVRGNSGADVPTTEAGWTVSSAGDFNGDGIDDLIVGSLFGKAYVVFGQLGGLFDLDLTSLSPSQGFALLNVTDSEWPYVQVSGAGDVNGDGFDDVILGLPDGDDGGRLAGETYVVFGNAGPGADIDLGALDAEQGLVIQGDNEGDFFGSSVSSAGDVNGDGLADIIAGTPFANGDTGRIYAIFGQSDGVGLIDLSSLSNSQGFSINSGEAGSFAGFSVSSAGDFNGDGYGDMIIGAPESRAGGNYSGKAHVIFGQANGFSNLDLDNLTAAQGFSIQNDAGFEFFGASVSSAGDINGDGYDDLLVGAPGQSGDGGEAYVIFGQAGGIGTLDLSGLTASQGFVITGVTQGHGLGLNVSTAGDVNADGFDDIIVGSENGGFAATPSAGGSGTNYVIFGKAGGFGDFDVSALTPSQGFAIQGSDGEAAGFSASSAGDVNGDGIDDIILGAPLNEAGGGLAGAAYVVYGRAPDEAVTRFGSEADQTIRGGAFDDQLNGLGGDDALFGGGGSDLILGGDGDDVLEGMSEADALIGEGGADTASYQTSTDSVAVNIGNGTGHGADAAGDVLVGIENLTGSEFGDLLRGGGATANNPTTDNVLSGLGGGDVILGDAGNDVIFGGAGGDVMTGGSGDDSFVFDNLSAEQDIIIDFDQAGDDVITFTGFGPGFDFSDIQIFNVNDMTNDGIDNGDAFIIATGWAGGVVLKNAFTLMDAGDFVFV